MDIRNALLSGMPATSVAQSEGRQAVIEELWDMIGSDLADHALRAAIALGETSVASHAARVIKCSGSYSQSANDLASHY